MIVSNFTPNPSGALQGLDFLSRAPKADANDPGEAPKFSDLLGAPDRPDAPVSSLREVRPPTRSDATSHGAEKSSGLNFVGQKPQVAGEGASGEVVSDAPAAPTGLDAAPPLIRDPRLDDPAELALEAAAIALAASMLQKMQVPLPQPPVVAEPELDLGLGQGGSQAQEKEQGPNAAVALPVSVPLPSAVQVGGIAQPILATAGAVVVPAEHKTVGPRVAVSKVQPQEQPQTAGIPSSVNAPAPASVVPSIVVKATPVQAAALSAATEGLLFPQSVESDPVSQNTIGPALSQSFVVQPSLAESVQISEESAVEMVSASPNRASDTDSVIVQALPDAEFLASAPPVNPAAAFFAGQALQQQPKSGSATVEMKSGTEELPIGAPEGESDVALDGKIEGLGLVRKETQGTEGEGHSKQAKASASGVKSELTPEAKQSRTGGTEVGTFGAEEGVVQRETSPVMARSEESSTPVTAEVDAFSSQAALGAELPTEASSQVGVAARPVHGEVATPSRPTVLPPVHAKATELFNVVQNALERARSENPSHLAVEVTLDDGSSFGLEVRMSASGLQASFRSESQPLLKALESNWAGFLAKETADAKVVTAAFEGRSGFGEFSNEGSNAGERRQQFEDNASAATLAGRDTGKSTSQKPQAEAPSKNLAATGGMALYA